MALVNFNDVSKHFGAADILRDLRFSLEPGMHVGLVGENGCGKSTLLRLITGEIQPDSGTLEIVRGLRLGYQPQASQQNLDTTPLVAALDARPALAARFRQCCRLESAATHDTQAALAYAQQVAEYDAAGGFTFEAEVQRVLGGLGLGTAQLALRLSSLSGGELARVGLAQALLCDPQLLLLDEPDSHLDLAGIQWLEQTLRAYQGTLLLVSHDRELLQSTVNVVLELEHGTARLEHGSLADYFARKAQRFARQQTEYLEQQRRVQRIKADIRRTEEAGRRFENISTNDHWRRVAKKIARTAVVRKQRLEKELDSEHRVERPRVASRLQLKLTDPHRRSRGLLQLEGVSLAYGERTLLHEIDLTLGHGQRLALLGANGCGKSTLLKAIMGQLPLDAGEIWMAGSARVFYCDQQQAGLNPAQSAYDTLAETSDLSTNQLHYLLAQLKLKGRLAQQPVGQLSGGERTRLLLALLMNTHADLLLLDEPSNHLDLPSIEVLQSALARFAGAVLLVSHDRRLVKHVATDVLELRAGRLMEVAEVNCTQQHR